MTLDALAPPERPTSSVGDQARTLGDMFLRRVEASPDRRAWRAKRGSSWKGTTWRQAHDEAAAVGTWLIQQGLENGDKVLMVGSTRPEWCVCDLAGQLAGMVTIGAYPTLTNDQLAYVIEHSDTRVIFVEGAEGVERVRAIRGECPQLQRIVVWDPEGVELGDDVVSLADVLKTEAKSDELAARESKVEREAVAIIVYTSGTTGPPKGAMITHANILGFVNADLGYGFDIEDEGLSFLPMAHVAERIANFYVRIHHGMGTAFASSIPAVLTEIQEVKPTLFGSVPRIFEKAHDRVQGEVEKAPAMRQKVFRWAESVGLRVVDAWQQGQPVGPMLRLQYKLADKIVYSKLRDVFGGKVRFFLTGAAPIPDRVLRFFWAMGFRVFEAYGQTEATVITHGNRPGYTRLGSVGRPLPGVEQKLADDGEVLVRGSCVFAGYHKNPEATAETVDEDGWLHTGDIGRIDDDGFLFLVDRKKHIIITAGGKNLTPANIENAIKAEDPLISQVHAHGDRRPYVGALVTLSPVDSIDFALGQGKLSNADADRMRAALIENPLARPEGLDALLAQVGEMKPVQERIIAAVRRGNAALSRVEKVKRVVVLDRELSLEEDEITPTLKVKRKNVEKHFAELFDRLYEDDGFGLTIEQRRN